MAIYLNNVGGNIELISGDAPARIYYGGAGTSGSFKPADVSRAGELNGFLINLGGDSYSFKFDDLVINGYSPTTLEFASEALQALFSQTPYTPPPLILQYFDASKVPYTTLGDWNTFFDLPTYGLPFTSVEIQGRSVYLRGGKNITLKDSLFFQESSIISVDDDAFCITSAETQAFGYCGALGSVYLPLLKTAGDSCFSNCSSVILFDLPSLQTAGISCFESCTTVTSFNLPLLQNAGNNCFANCPSVTSFNLPLLQTAGGSCFSNCSSVTLFNLPSVINLGESVEDDLVFKGITGNTISLTIPSALMTCNAGQPDGDILFLQANNTVTINQV